MRMAMLGDEMIYFSEQNIVLFTFYDY